MYVTPSFRLMLARYSAMPSREVVALKGAVVLEHPVVLLGEHAIDLAPSHPNLKRLFILMKGRMSPVILSLPLMNASWSASLPVIMAT